jgi:hypothetical protein
MSSEHAGLLRRVTKLLRPTATPEPDAADDAPAAAASAQAPDVSDLEALRERVSRLEAMVEGLQDALYRHAQQQDERISELRRRTEPEEIARALNADQRRRGI